MSNAITGLCHLNRFMDASLDSFDPTMNCDCLVSGVLCLLTFVRYDIFKAMSCQRHQNIPVRNTWSNLFVTFYIVTGYMSNIVETWMRNTSETGFGRLKVITAPRNKV